MLERSLLDIFRDIVYFPYVTTIIATFVRIATYKPHPAQVPEIVRVLPKEVVDVATRKGLLSLTPSALEQILLPIDKRELPKDYGMNQEQWDRME